MALESSSGSRRVGRELRTGEGGAADLERARAGGLGVADDHLGRPAADVDHEAGPWQRPRRRGRPRTSTGPPRPAVSTRSGPPRIWVTSSDERVGVGGVTGGRGRDRRHQRHPLLVDQRPVAPQHRRGPLEPRPDRAGRWRTGRPTGGSGGTGAGAAGRPGGRAAGPRSSPGRWRPLRSRALRRPLELGRHPSPDRVVAAGQVPGVVGMEALDALSCPAHTAARRRAGVSGRQRGVTLRRVAEVRVGERAGRHLALGPAHATGGLEPADRRVQRGARPASSGSASACRRRAAARCG